MDGIEFIHPEMVRFAYSCPISEDKDELMAGVYLLKFDEATIDVELGMNFDDFLGEALLLNRDESALEDALRELCIEWAAWRFTTTEVRYLPSNQLTLEATFWNYWVKNCVFPTTHDKKVSVQ